MNTPFPICRFRALLIRLILPVLLLQLCGVGQAVSLDFPGGNPPKGAVPIGLLKKIAQSTAEHISGMSLVAGKPIPYCNFAGEIIAYEFPFCVSCRAFPSDDEVVLEIRSARELARGTDGKKYQKLPWGVGKYWSVTVSSAEDRYPVLEISEGLPRFYTMGDIAQERARGKLGGGAPRLVRIFYASPVEQLFEFSSGGRTVLANPFSLKMYPPGQVKERQRKTSEGERKIIKEKWSKVKADAK